jgi:uncharacterized protein (UPF0261 family)
MALKERLAGSGYEAVIFHSNGVGGPAMEEMAQAGQFVGVIDFTTNETYDPMTGGIHDGGPDRLRVIGLLGLPQVVVPGCIDFCVFHAGSIPKELQGRPVYDHNPEYTLVRATKAEMIALGRLFAERLNPAKGPVIIAVPTQGFRSPTFPAAFSGTRIRRGTGNIACRYAPRYSSADQPRHVNDRVRRQIAGFLLR